MSFAHQPLESKLEGPNSPEEFAVGPECPTVSMSPQQPSTFTTEDTPKERAEKIIFLIENHKEFKPIGKLDQQHKDYILEKEEMIRRGEYKRPSSHFGTAFIVSVAIARDMLTQNVKSSNTKFKVGSSPFGESDEPRSPDAGLSKKRKSSPYRSGSDSSAENGSKQQYCSPSPGR